MSPELVVGFICIAVVVTLTAGFYLVIYVHQKQSRASTPETQSLQTENIISDWETIRMWAESWAEGVIDRKSDQILTQSVYRQIVKEALLAASLPKPTAAASSRLAQISEHWVATIYEDAFSSQHKSIEAAGKWISPDEIQKIEDTATRVTATKRAVYAN